MQQDVSKIMRIALSLPFVAVALSASLFAAGSPTTQRSISVDVTQIRGPRDNFWRACVGSERAGVMLRPENLQQLALVQKEIGFQRIRFHGIFHDDMNVYREVDGKPVYDFSKIDTLYDAFLKLGIRPFVELSFMPHDLASGTTTVFYWKGNVTPPKDYEKWAALIGAFAKHLLDRYGPTEVENWNFEVWNEPNLASFFKGTRADYFHLYDVTSKAIKSVDEKLKVGGPATAGAAWIPEFIGHCCEQHDPLDFISTHTYGSDKVVDEAGKRQPHLLHNLNAVESTIRRTHQQIASSTQPSLPLHYTEWSTSSSSRDPVHDDYLSAAYICEKLKACEGVLSSMSYWTYSDLFEEMGPPPTPFHGGFGLLNREGIRKASFFAYKYLNELGGSELINADKHSWVCTDDKGEVTALLWNLKAPDIKVPDAVFFIVKRPAVPAEHVALQINGLAAGQYNIELHRTGFEANDAYTAYLDMGRPKKLSPDQLVELQKKSADEPESVQTVAVSSGTPLSLPVDLRENDVVFVRISNAAKTPGEARTN
jgi:xylan 1,4-beta-xylosidase